MKKVMLISPRMAGEAGGVNRLQPGLGLGYIAAMLEQEGFSVRVFDAALAGESKDGFLGCSDGEAAAAIADFGPDFVGITIPFSSAARDAYALAKISKTAAPRAPVILGGAHSSGVLLDYSAGFGRGALEMAASGADYAMCGECDAAFGQLLGALSSGADAASVPGAAAMRGGELRLSGKRPAADINSLPEPARHLMDMEGYFRHGKFHSSKSTGRRVLNVITSRGCPENCFFCSTPSVWGRRLRLRNPASVLAEISGAVSRYNIEEIQFEDDSLTASAEHINQLCSGLERLGLPWCTPNGIRADYQAKDRKALFSRMKRAGCYQITLACESGSQRVLDGIIGKRLRAEEFRPAIDAAKEAGLFVHTFWMAGFPGETRAEMELTAKTAAESGADSFSLAIAAPLPGTPLYRMAEAQNLWWPGIDTRRAGNYRRSAIRADGFSGPEEFELWADGLNAELNLNARRQDPQRAKRRAAMVYDAKLAQSAVKQT
ncbi:MAG: radical SAM protein [Elusimicrobiales bacterium]